VGQKIKVFEKWVKLQGQGHKVKNFGTNRKVLLQGTNIWNMKAISLPIQKIGPMLKFLQTDRQTGQKLYAPDLSIRGHKK
jgi:hypothetical protein